MFSLCRFGLGFVKPSGDTTNACLVGIGVSDTVIGAHEGLGIGNLEPVDLDDGTNFYGFTWDYPTVGVPNITGDFQIRFGDNGDYKILNVTKLLLKSGDGNDAGTAEWNETTKSYNLTNLPMAGQLNAQYDAGEIPPFCFSMTLLLEGDIIIYDFAKLWRR